MSKSKTADHTLPASAGESVIIIRSNRKKIILQWAITLVIGFSLAYFLEISKILKTSKAGRLAEFTNLPIVGLLIIFITLLIVIVPFKNNWFHLITLDNDKIEIKKHLGLIRIPYADIVEVKIIPRWGAGIKLCGSGNMANYIQATPKRKEQLLAAAGLNAGQHGCEACILSKHLESGTEKFVKLLQERIEQYKQNPPPHDKEVLVPETNNDFNLLVNNMLSFAQESIKNCDWFIPFGAGLKTDGSIELFMRKIDEKTDPQSLQDPQALLDQVIDNLRRQRESLCAIGTACQGHYLPADGSKMINVIQIHLEHINNSAAMFLLPFEKTVSGDYYYGEPNIMEDDLKVFGEK